MSAHEETMKTLREELAAIKAERKAVQKAHAELKKQAGK